MRVKFLTGQWDHLLLTNYSVAPELLRPYVPNGTHLDLFEGHALVRLVAFMFNRTRVMGISVPFHRDFEEVSLRFYVTPDKARTIRDVMFIKEIVPKQSPPGYRRRDSMNTMCRCPWIITMARSITGIQGPKPANVPSAF